MEFILEREENFRIWKKYLIVEKYRDVIITFIDNGILEHNKEYFKELFNGYLNLCDDFYKSVIDVYNKYNKENKKIEYNQGIKFDIYFKERRCIINIINEIYNKLTFTLGSLDLKPMYKDLVLEILYEDLASNVLREGNRDE